MGCQASMSSLFTTSAFEISLTFLCAFETMRSKEDKTMKNILIITLGIVALFFSATFANAQTLKSDKVEFCYINVVIYDWSNYYAHYCTDPIDDIVSVTMPSTKDPKWTIVYKNGVTTVTTAPLVMTYRQKSGTSQPDQIEPE
jgi:hypothetical protein